MMAGLSILVSLIFLFSLVSKVRLADLVILGIRGIIVTLTRLVNQVSLCRIVRKVSVAILVSTVCLVILVSLVSLVILSYWSAEPD